MGCGSAVYLLKTVIQNSIRDNTGGLYSFNSGGLILYNQTFTIAKGIEIIKYEDQRVLINPKNREWVKLADYAYEFALNPEGKPIKQLIADEARRTGGTIETIGSLFYYLKGNGFLMKIDNTKGLARAYFNITAQCNLMCPLCYFASEASKEYKELPYKDARLIIDILAEAGINNLIVSGGEPLLYQNFQGVLEYAKGKFPSITVLTNGTIISKEDATLISKSMAKVQVSIESANPQVHDNIRGYGSFNKTLRGIKTLLQANVHNIEIVQTLTRNSIHESEGVIKLANILGIDYHFSLFLPIGRGASHARDMEIPKAELKEHFLKVCSRPLKAIQRVEPRVQGTSSISQPNECKPPVDLVVKTRCGAGSNIISIAPNGKVYPCPLLHTEDLVLGELPKDLISEIIKKGTSRVPGIASLPECQGCDVAFFCGGGCRARAFAHTGDLFSKDPYCKFYKSVFPAVLWEWREDRVFSDNIAAILSCIEKEG